MSDKEPELTTITTSPRSGSPPDMVLVDAGVQSRLSTIDTRAKLLPERATRKQRNNPSLDNT